MMSRTMTAACAAAVMLAAQAASAQPEAPRSTNLQAGDRSMKSLLTDGYMVAAMMPTYNFGFGGVTQWVAVLQKGSDAWFCFQSRPRCDRVVEPEAEPDSAGSVEDMMRRLTEQAERTRQYLLEQRGR
jgi:hypothetical protein